MQRYDVLISTPEGGSVATFVHADSESEAYDRTDRALVDCPDIWSGCKIVVLVPTPSPEV